MLEQVILRLLSLSLISLKLIPSALFPFLYFLANGKGHNALLKKSGGIVAGVQGVPNRPGSATHCWQNPKAERQVMVKQERKLVLWGPQWPKVPKIFPGFYKENAGQCGWGCEGKRWKIRLIIVLESIMGEVCWFKVVLIAWGASFDSPGGCFALRVTRLSAETSWKEEPS